MSEGQRKMIGPIVAVVSVAAAVGAYVGIKEGIKAFQARKAKQTATAGWGLEPAARDRIFTVLEREMKPLLEHPRFKAYQKQELAAAKAKGTATKVDELAFSKELGRMVVARGVPRLPDADISAFHGLKKKMVFASKRMCPCFWDPSTCTDADIMDGLSRLSVQELEIWSRMSAAAAFAEVDATAPFPETQDDFQAGLTAIAERLPASKRARFDAIIGGSDGTAASKADQCFAIQSMFTGADALPPADRIRFARALANAGIER